MPRRSVALAALLLGVLALLPGSATAGPLGTWCGDHSRLTVLGSSSSTGVATTGYADDGQGLYQPTRYGWWKRVTDHARAAWGTAGTNSARIGAVTSDFAPTGRWPVTRDALPRLAAEQPDLVILQLGTNEYLNGHAPAAFEAEYARLVDDIRAARPGVDLLILLGWRVAKPDAAHPWSDYTAAMGRVARTRGAAVLDLRQFVDGSDLDAAGVYAADRVHLNDAGQTVLAGAVWSQLVASTC